jgi:hypothetical protein
MFLITNTSSKLHLKLLVFETLLNNLSWNVGALVRNTWHAVDDNRLSFGNREKEFVVHPDVSAQHDAVRNLEIGCKILLQTNRKISMFKLSFLNPRRFLCCHN